MSRNFEEDVQRLCEIGVRKGVLFDNDFRRVLQINDVPDCNTLVAEFPEERQKYIQSFSNSPCCYNPAPFISDSMANIVRKYLRENYMYAYFEATASVKFGDFTKFIMPDLAYQLDFKGWDKEIKIKPAKYIPKRIWRTPGGYTTVEWDDKTKTTVKAESEEFNTEFAGFSAALAKKMFGSTSEVIRAIDHARENTEWPSKKAKMAREEIKELKRLRHEERIARRERRIAERMESLRIDAEAKKRMEKEEQT